jgi:hypothetical protein
MEIRQDLPTAVRGRGVLGDRRSFRGGQRAACARRSSQVECVMTGAFSVKIRPAEDGGSG